MSSIHQIGHDTMVTNTFTNNCFTHRADSHDMSLLLSKNISISWPNGLIDAVTNL